MILNNLISLDTKHYFKINKHWNDDVIDNKQYDFVIFDNIPSNQEELNIIEEFKNIKNQLFVLGPNVSPMFSNQFLSKFDCKIYSQHEKPSSKYLIQNNNDKLISSPNNSNLKCYCYDEADVVRYSDGSIFLYNKNGKMLLFVDDLFKMEVLNNRFGNNNNLKFIMDKLENNIYNRSKSLDVVINKEFYNVNENIEVYLRLNDNTKFNNMNLKLINDNNIIVFNEKKQLDSTLYKFNFQIKQEGKYSIVGSLISDDDDIKSNLVELKVLNQDYEIRNIYLDQDNLLNITNNNNGVYAQFKDYEQVLNSLSDKVNTEKNTFSKSLINFNYLFIILIFSLLSEWFLRSKVGLL